MGLKLAKQIVEKLKQHSFEAVIAGGWVRDKLLGAQSSDIDIATNATPQEVEKIFPKTIPVGKAFGVMIVVLEGEQFEVATFRTDSDSSDGRRPDSVTFSSMKEDAERRDLTINGLFFDPLTENVHDFVGGQQDIEDGVIRFIGNPSQRIAEDKLRILRAVRFAARMDFKIESATLEALKKHCGEVVTVSAERIGEELLKMLRLENADKAFLLLKETGILKHVLPEISAMVGVEQSPEHHPEGDVFVHTMLALKHLPENATDELRMAALLHDVGKPVVTKFERGRWRFDGHEITGAEMTDEILSRLRFSNEFIKRVSALVANHMKFIHVKQMRVAKLKRFVRQDHFEEHKALHKVDSLASHGDLSSLEFLETLEFPPETIKPKPLINGHDLIKLGLKPGPKFKEILVEFEDAQLEGRITTREEALKMLEKALKGLDAKWLRSQ